MSDNKLTCVELEKPKLLCVLFGTCIRNLFSHRAFSHFFQKQTEKRHR